MSDNSIPTKGTYVLNPKTSRMIKVGSRAWLKCVKEGILNGAYKDADRLAKIKDDEPIHEQIETVQKKLPISQQAVRGRGRHRNSIVKRNKPVSARESQRYTIKTAQKVVNENLDELIDADDVEAELEKLINEELASLEKGKTNNDESDESYDDDYN